MNGWWNPRGTAAAARLPCDERVVLRREPGGLGAGRSDRRRLAGADAQVSAKLVDLDTEQQMVSEIWGLRLRLLDSQGGRPGAAASRWRRSLTSGPLPGNPDSFFGAVYQSVITDVQVDGQESPLLQQLRPPRTRASSRSSSTSTASTTRPPRRRSPGGGSSARSGRTRRVSRSFVAARYLQPPAGSPLNNAPCSLGEQDAVRGPGQQPADGGTVGGPLVGLDALRVEARRSAACSRSRRCPPTETPSLATLDSLGGSTSTRPASSRRAERRPARGKVRTQSASSTARGDHAALGERRGDVPARRRLRLPDGPERARHTATTTLYATRLGVPRGVEIDVWHNDVDEQGQVKQGVDSRAAGRRAACALTFPDSVTTGPDGTAPLQLTAKPRPARVHRRPGLRRQLRLGPRRLGHAAAAGWSVLVFDDYQVPERPTWVADALPGPPAVRQPVSDHARHPGPLGLPQRGPHRRALQLVFGLAVEDPELHAGDADLSPAKRDAAEVARRAGAAAAGDHGRREPEERPATGDRASTRRSRRTCAPFLDRRGPQPRGRRDHPEAS